METLSKIVIDSQVYYSADAIKTKTRAFAMNARSARDMVRQRKVFADAYIYARQQKGSTTYKKTDGSANQDKVYFTEAFTMTIAELNPQAIIEPIVVSVPTVATEVVERVRDEKAPEIIEFHENEKFRDDNGDIIAIETRGERTYDGIYFTVKDVSNGFGIENIKDTLIQKNSGYTRNVDYKAFVCSEAIIYRRGATESTHTPQSICF